jgi:hypothetical protein
VCERERERERQTDRQTWLLILGEDRRLKVFENRVLRRIFGPKRDMVMRVRKAA